MAISNQNIDPDKLEEELKNFEVEEEEVSNLEEENKEEIDKTKLEELNKKLELIENEKLEKRKEKKDKEVVESEEEDKNKEIDYRARYIGSSQEARVLSERNKLYQEALKKAEEIKDVSTDELIKVYGEEKYASADDEELKLMKENLIAKKKLELINEAFKKDEQVEKWLNQVKNYILSDEVKEKYPELLEYKDDFVRFTAMPTRVGLDLDMLARTFLFDKKKPVHTGNVLLGKSKKITEEPVHKITPEEAELLRKTNFRLYKKMVAEGRIDLEI